jgi:ParB family chromosome partitioning protein
MMYQRALDAGLFPTMLALSQAIGRSVGAVSNAIAIANLPSEVVAAFNSPSEIQFRYAKELRDAVAKAPEAVVEAAKALLAIGPQPPAEVFKALTRAGAGSFQPLKTNGSETSEAVSGKQTQATADGFQPLKTANHAVSMDSGGGCGKDRTGMPGAPERRLRITGKPVVIQSDGTDTVVRINAALLPRERWAEFEKAIRKLLA